MHLTIGDATISVEDLLFFELTTSFFGKKEALRIHLFPALKKSKKAKPRVIKQNIPLESIEKFKKAYPSLLGPYRAPSFFGLRKTIWINAKTVDHVTRTFFGSEKKTVIGFKSTPDNYPLIADDYRGPAREIVVIGAADWLRRIFMNAYSCNAR